MINWDTELIDSLARRRCVIVIGSGVSRNSVNSNGKRPESWEGFLNNCSKSVGHLTHIDDLISKKDYLTACEFLKNHMTDDKFYDEVQKEYQRAGYSPAEIHKNIYNLDASIVITTNIDNIYDDYARSVSIGTIVIKDQNSQDIANYLQGGEKRLLLKSHGSANDPHSVVFTRSDYARVRTENRLYYEIMKSLVLTHTFLFIGCGTDDPDIRLLFEDVQFAHVRLPFHYMTLPNNESNQDIEKVFKDTMRVIIKKYDSAGNHQILTDSLKDLVAIVEDKRINYIANSMKW